jgi:hypothetical protein
VIASIFTLFVREDLRIYEIELREKRKEGNTQEDKFIEGKEGKNSEDKLFETQ